MTQRLLFRSTSSKPILLLALQKLNGAGMANVSIWNQCWAVPPLIKFGLRSRLGRCAGPAPIFALSLGRLIVIGAPVWSVPMVFTVQPFGNTYVPVNTNR